MKRVFEWMYDHRREANTLKARWRVTAISEYGATYLYSYHRWRWAADFRALHCRVWGYDAVVKPWSF